MTTNQVNTVLGPVAPENLGVTLMHEHVLYGYPGWEGDQSVAPFDRRSVVSNAVSVLKDLRENFDLKTYVDATPNDGGRNVDVLKEVSEKSGVNIVCASGYYFEGEGAPTYWKFRASMGDIREELYELFMKEATVGIQGSGVKAGVIKVGSSMNQITDYEKLMFATAARVQKDAGIPIITHTQHGTMGPEQAALLIASGADAGQIQIGHMSDNLDMAYQEKTFGHGVYVAWDRMGLQGLVGCPMDEARYPVMIDLIQKGYGSRLMISHDFVINWLGRPLNLPEQAYPLVANWHPSHLFRNIIPALKKGGVTDAQIKEILEDNPRRFFAGK